MPVLKYGKVMERMFNKPVFGVDDLRNCGVPAAYAKKRLHDLAKRGKIKRIERGKYTTLDDAVAVAAHIAEPSYLSLWSAMSIRGLTTQIPFAIEVVTSARVSKRRLDFGGTPIIFHTVRSAMMFGYENIVWTGGVRIAVAKPEKIVIDALYIGGVPSAELKGALKASNATLLTQYANLTNDKRIIRKVKELVKC
jgi:predicted transcriptional regulator of viral defense system